VAQVSDIAKVGERMEFIITKDDSDTKDQIVLLSLRRIAVRLRGCFLARRGRPPAPPAAPPAAPPPAADGSPPAARAAGGCVVAHRGVAGQGRCV
jgi:hypothetical protein